MSQPELPGTECLCFSEPLPARRSKCNLCGRVVDPAPAAPKDVLLVGESNPYGPNPDHALYPWPERSAGHRLCTLVMGMNRARYLRTFDRVNLCAGKWSMPEAREHAARIVEVPRKAIVLCGKKVTDAFGVSFEPFTIRRFVAGHFGATPPLVIIPHPSGLSRSWNESGAFQRAREVLERAGVLAKKE